jgi:hypothetical protein
MVQPPRAAALAISPDESSVHAESDNGDNKKMGRSLTRARAVRDNVMKGLE